VHGFTYHDRLEKLVIDSPPFQRLRSIHQLAMCYQVYPGATHRRFEHSLGVMELAGRIFDALFGSIENIDAAVRDRISEQLTPSAKDYWRRVVRMAALLHDVGHLPFSHAAEAELLPKGCSHETVTADIIRNSVIKDILNSERPPINVEDVVRIACDEEARGGDPLTPWEAILNEIITGRTFGADRMDYLLRDSYHTGVAYGRFDPDRLIGGLRLVIQPDNEEIAIALEAGSIQSSEALLLARYFMYSQVYFHKTRRSYDIHLKDFMIAWLKSADLPEDWYRWNHINGLTDDEVMTALRLSSADSSHAHHGLATRLVGRKHFRMAYALDQQQLELIPALLTEVSEEAVRLYGAENVRVDKYGPKSEINDFCVRMSESPESEVRSSLQVSGVISAIPAFLIGYIFVAPDLALKARPELNAFAQQKLELARAQKRQQASGIQ
jgi:hypothetical protein